MDLTSQYCQLRRDIEERSWVLVSRLSMLTECLNRLIGQHAAFRDMKLQCAEVRQEIAASNLLLKKHRAAHRC